MKNSRKTENNRFETAYAHLTKRQRRIIMKHYDYLLYLDYLLDTLNGEEKEAVQDYRAKVVTHIAALCEKWEAHNALTKKGILKK
ncbi:hypothetical protein C6503_19490 [Candidatus Poribacteria bacterium]|nr:MAG: hypothetical protein C6503_19490 [Candidatus Poribacteria bacterium]